MRFIYESRPGGKPFNVGMNNAKRVARAADKRDQRAVQRELGFGLPEQRSHHQQLVKSRHGYYHDRYEQLAAQSRGAGADASNAGDAGGEVPEPSAGSDH